MLSHEAEIRPAKFGAPLRECGHDFRRRSRGENALDINAVGDDCRVMFEDDGRLNWNHKQPSRGADLVERRASVPCVGGGWRGMGPRNHASGKTGHDEEKKTNEKRRRTSHHHSLADINSS